MGLRDQISSDIKDAMRAKDSAKLNALRMVQSAFKNREIELRPEPMNEDEHLGILKKLVKQRKESIEQYAAAKRQRVEAWLAAQGLDRGDCHIRFYSDHFSDQPMFEFADEAVAVNAHRPLRMPAAARGWAMRDWRTNEQFMSEGVSVRTRVSSSSYPAASSSLSSSYAVSK